MKIRRMIIWVIVLACLCLTACIKTDEGSESIDSIQAPDLELVLVEDQVESVDLAEGSLEDQAIGISDVALGYYGDTYELTGSELKAVLNDIISQDHAPLSYDQVYSALEDTDEDLEDPSKVVLFYKDVLVGDNDLRMSDDDDIWNREHIWAKSHGDFGTYRGPGTDLHMIRPTDASVNGRRGHLDFDESDTPFDEVKGTYVDEDSFEPRDDIKGDVARMLFYMAVRYEGEDGEVDLELSDRTDTYYRTEQGYGEHGKLSTLLKWHVQDPVDEFEIIRNDRVHGIQGNRNPFIDHPEFVAMIWGQAGSTLYLSDSQDDDPLDTEAVVGTIEALRYMEDGRTGVVSATVTFIENDTTMYVQEGEWGIRVDSHGSDLSLKNYHVGQGLRISGQVTTYKGEKELRVNRSDQLIEIDKAVVPSPVTTSLLAVSDGERQGVLVVLEDLVVLWKDNRVFQVEDEEGYRMTVYIGEGSDVSQDEIVVGGELDLVGIPSWFEEVQIKVVERIE